jgi:hypothetical protein
MSDTVMAVFGMPTKVTVEMIPHVDQLLGNHDLDTPRVRYIDALEIDEHSMNPGMAKIHICATIGGRDAPPKPGAELRTIRRHAKVFQRQVEPPRVVFRPYHNAGIRRSEHRASSRINKVLFSASGHCHVS